jgi:predicted transcriptional regulator
MDIQADIIWIKAELDQVKDPHLIEAFKNMLNYRRSAKANDGVQEEMERMVVEGLDDINNGRVISTEDLRKDVSTWK